MSSKLLVSVIALAFVAGCARESHEWHAKSIRGLMPPLEFTLTSENGQEVSAQDYRGKTVLLFFGYTNCPDYCPTTLSRLKLALDKLPDLRSQVVILFVSVDPKRDTLEYLRQYTSNFAPEVIGLTGSMKALSELAKRYRTTFSYGEPDEHGFYAVSHGIAVYAFDTAGAARLMMLQEEKPDEIAADIKQLVELGDSP
ncbi:MAG: SCO family protein [Pseudomonadales bacterium]|nr:SCO family protein [Pseudomonadales bacterium]